MGSGMTNIKGYRVSVYGSSIPQPGTTDYEKAKALGGMLGQNGYTVLTGGYAGTMEAVSRGASEAGGHVIGVTCSEIENFRPGKANPWVSEEIHLDSLEDRLIYLLTQCDGAVALPGGIGTLAEIVILWNKLQVKSISARPFVLVGTGWKTVIDTLFAEQGSYIPPAYRTLLHTAPSVKEAFQFLNSTFHTSD